VSAFVYLALPLGWDLVPGRLGPPATRALARAYAPSAAILVAYFALRWVAFGNFVGGDGAPIHYLEPAAFLGFHVQFWRSLGDPTLLSLGGIRGAPAFVATFLLLLTVAACWRPGSLPVTRRRALLFYGPLWYLASTAILHGTYFAVRHNLLPVIGIGLFLTIAADTLLLRGVLRSARVTALAIVAAAVGLLLPPSLATSAEWRSVAASVSAIRAEIEERTAGLAPGCAVSLSGVPQWVLPPFYFGWGLRSALARPFTASDLARVCTVVDARNLELTGVRVAVPERFDAVIAFDPKQWVPPAVKQRHLQRLWREGIVAKGERRIP